MKSPQQMYQFLNRHRINIDDKLVDQTVLFIEDFVGKLTPGQEEYQIFAASALTGEAMVSKDTTLNKRARSIVTLEHVMRHIGNLSKEKYLEVLTRQVAKWREAPHWLKVKTENLKFAYRIYKKYRSVFDELTLANPNMEQGVRFNLMAIFWILYLFLKRQHAEFDNIVESTILLHSIILFFFSEVSAQMTHHESSKIFRSQFPQSKMPQQNKLAYLNRMLTQKLNQIHQHRHHKNEINLQQLATDSDYITRFLDDMNIMYDKQVLPQKCINQISFLELDRTLTPMAIPRHFEVEEPISKIINFDQSSEENQRQESEAEERREDDQGEQENSMRGNHLEQSIKNSIPNQEETLADKANPFKRSAPKFQPPLSPFKPYLNRFNKGELTPVTARHQNLGWVNGITANFSQMQTNEVKRIYQKYVKKSYKAYQKLAFSRLHRAIVEFTSQCMDYEKRKRSIYHFFEHFVNQIAQKHSQNELASIFNQDSNFNSILCLSVDLFNYAYHSLDGSYRNYCKIFDISLLEGHKPINWFGNHVSMPKNLQTYLYELERKILILQIWENNQGYILLTDQEEQKKYHIQALIKRLQKHTNERTQQLCQKMNIQEKQVMRIVTLVKFILQKRPILMKNHKIDQIIVCSIASILSINRSQTQFNLQQIFYHYNKLILSFYNNRSDLFNSEGNRIDLVDFYNNIFLPSVEEIINNQDHTGILSTPIRLQTRKRKQLGIQLTPISRKFRHVPPILAPPRKLKMRQPIIHEKVQAEDNDENSQEQFECRRKDSYRFLLANSLKNLDFDQQNKDIPSPSFGGNNTNGRISIYRTYSFGDINDKI